MGQFVLPIKMKDFYVLYAALYKFIFLDFLQLYLKNVFLLRLFIDIYIK